MGGLFSELDGLDLEIFCYYYKRVNQNNRNYPYRFRLIFSIFFRLESGLTCFECSSTVSHKECEERHQQVTCQSSMADRCYYASMQQTSRDRSSVTKRFEHGCINNKDCSNTANIFAQCTTSTEQCEVRCCSENLCNEGNAGRRLTI